MKKKYLLSVAAITIFSQVALAQEFRRLDLLPTADSDDLSTNFRIYEAEGGIYLFNASGTIKKNDYFGFSFKIDLKNETYTTKVIDPLTVAMLVEPNIKALKGAKKIRSSQSLLSIQCNLSLTVQTKDIVWITLAQTDSNISWEEDSTAGTVKPLSASFSPWANPLTPAFTTWYINGTPSAYITPSGGVASSTIHAYGAADYINWDWLDDELATHSDHEMEVDLWPEDSNGDIGSWDRDAIHYGESGGALIGNYYGGGSCS